MFIRFATVLLLVRITPIALAQTSAGTLQGAVTDPSGAVIPAAAVMVSSEAGAVRTVVTDAKGSYRIELPSGRYSIRITKPGFTPFERTDVVIAGSRAENVNAQLYIRQESENLTISATASQLGVDASQSAGQLVLRGSDLDSFSDDPEDLANDLQMLAGPAAGPNGGQMFIDGFSEGILPPKASIREIRVNSNPFSAEYDRMGFGRVEVFTKPGSAKFHGQASFDFGNRALTARNPFLVGPLVPNYRQEMFAGNFGGPLSKKASFFIDVDRRITDENAIFNYTALDSELKPAAFSGAVIAPSRRLSVNPRIDYALSPNQTLTLRYSLVDTNAQNQGINVQAFDEASQAYRQNGNQQSLQVAESAVIGSAIFNDARFQFLHTRSTQSGTNTTPEIDVQGAFTGGGTFPLNFTNENKSEFQNNTTILRGKHTIKFGARLRVDRLAEQSTTNFNGRFIFSAIPGGLSSIEVYQQDQVLLRQGMAPQQIATLGIGPSEFLLTAGNPAVNVNVFDAGVYLQDEWRIRPNLSVTGGIRYEGQTAISDHADFAPRLGFAWAPGAGGRANPKTVIRAGSGIFYDRFPSNLLINAQLLNGVNQLQYIVRDPQFFPMIPDLATLAALSSQQAATDTRSVYQVAPQLRVPSIIQGAVGIERQLPHGISLAANYTASRGDHELLTRDINAPLPTLFNPSGQAIGPRPFGDAAGDIYQYEAAGVFRQNQFIVTANAKVNRKLTIYGYYVWNKARSDTDGSATMPSNPYNIAADYGRAAFDYRHRAFVSASMTLPLGLRMAPFIFLQSGMPYNVTSGIDTNGDGNPNDDRPALAQDLSRSSVIKTHLGDFDTDPATLANATIVPRNYLQGPGILSLNVRVSRSWSFGERGGGNTGGSAEIAGGGSIQNGGLSGGSSQSGAASVFGGVATAKRFNLTLTATFRNALNNVNPALPIGNLSSALFGQSVTLNTFGPLPGAGPNAGAGNRHIELQLRLTF